VDRARRQILLFRVLLTIISAVIMALIIYTLTLDKLHPIALLKLIGAPNACHRGPDPAAVPHHGRDSPTAWYLSGNSCSRCFPGACS
jgi:hypothetical protein